MNVVEAIRESVPLARVKGEFESRCDDGCVVVVRRLSVPDMFSVLVRGPQDQHRAATREEVEAAGFPYRGNIKVRLGDTLVAAAQTEMN
jgi:hypothetical protein